ncbi:MAG: hypothetical protein LBS27_12220 [Bifidobacteriaceae bacterium]|nr:hypothetical protein [Bifidobacteriaceae bacterium]
MNLGEIAGTGISRREAQDPDMARRIRCVAQAAAHDVHRRRLRQFAASDQGPVPRWEESRAIARDEVVLLARWLGPLITIQDGEFAAAAAYLAD